MGKKEKLEYEKEKNNIYEDNNIEQESNLNVQQIEKEIDQEYLYDTVYNIQSFLQKFVEENSLSLCEYPDDINFLNFVKHVLS